MNRRHPRHPVSLWAKEKVAARRPDGSVGSNDATYFHHVSNLSAGGLFFEKSIPVPVGTTIELEIPLPGRTVIARGKVVHATASTDTCGIGVELDGLPPEDKDAVEHYLALPELAGRHSS